MIGPKSLALAALKTTPLAIQHVALQLPELVTAHPVLSSLTYMAGANILYLARRASLRKETIGYIWKVRTTQEEGVTMPLFVTFLLVWQALVAVFPIVEPIARIFRHVVFFYSYPNASGCGIIFEPVDVQHLKRTKYQIRFDWHRFTLNVGNVGREGYRHPPSIERNLPHIDIPKLGMKHWPWRRKEKYLEKVKAKGERSAGEYSQ